MRDPTGSDLADDARDIFNCSHIVSVSLTVTTTLNAGQLPIVSINIYFWAIRMADTGTKRYIDGLTTITKLRYLEKLRDIDNIDPYETNE
jgi:hypothetical protein